MLLRGSVRDQRHLSQSMTRPVKQLEWKASSSPKVLGECQLCNRRVSGAIPAANRSLEVPSNGDERVTSEAMADARRYRCCP